jgi:hypothetical protein
VEVELTAPWGLLAYLGVFRAMGVERASRSRWDCFGVGEDALESG